MTPGPTSAATREDLGPRPCRLTVITPTLDAGARLARTLASSEHAEIEHIVVDGGSRDDTQAWYQRAAAPGLRDMRWLDEPDGGIYGAMNRGVDAARGDFVLFLGAGDELVGAHLGDFLARLDDGAEVVHGDLRQASGALSGGPFTAEDIAVMEMPHPAMAFRRTLWQWRRFDPRYRIGADHLFNIECMADPEVRIRYAPIEIARFEGGGISETGVDEDYAADLGAVISERLGRPGYESFKTSGKEFQVRARYSRRWRPLILGDDPAWPGEAAARLGPQTLAAALQRPDIDHPGRLAEVRDLATRADTCLVVATTRPYDWWSAATRLGIEDSRLLFARPAVLRPGFARAICDWPVRPVAVCGSGMAAVAVVRALRHAGWTAETIRVIDDRHGGQGTLEGLPIHAMRADVLQGAASVVVATQWSRSMRARLAALGVPEARIWDAVYGVG